VVLPSLVESHVGLHTRIFVFLCKKKIKSCTSLKNLINRCVVFFEFFGRFFIIAILICKISQASYELHF